MEWSLEKNITIALFIYLAVREDLKRPNNLSTECRSSQMHTDGALSSGLAGSMVMQREAKLPLKNGSSWVDVGNKTHVFGAKDWSHPRGKEIYEKLDSLLVEIKRARYVPCTNSVAVDMDDSEKLKVLQHHSERIAIAFALLSIPYGKPIIVKKNLRVCVDCHSAITYLSKVVGRKIIARDNSRYHYFADGSCSCGDYW